MKGDTRKMSPFYQNASTSILQSAYVYGVLWLSLPLFYNKMKEWLFVPIVASKRNNFYRNDVFVYAIN